MVHQSFCPSIPLSVGLSFSLDQFVGLSVGLPICWSGLSLYLSVHLSFSPSICVSTHLSVSLSFVHLSVSLSFVHLSVYH